MIKKNCSTFELIFKSKCLTKITPLIKKFIFHFVFLVTVLTSCSYYHPGSKNNNINLASFDLDSIRKRGKLIAVTYFNSMSYFIYKGEPMGFHYELLKSFSDHIGIDLEIITEDNLRNAFEMLKTGNADLLAVDCTISDDSVALVNASYFSDIDASIPVNFPHNITVGVRKNNSEKLLFELNRWITAYKKTGSYDKVYAKYFKNSRFGKIVKSNYYTVDTRKVSRYDDMIKKFSKSINWDWRLLASLICQESHFKPNVVSLAGAYGLMQIMPGTGKNFGIDVTASPEDNIKAGIRYITWLHSIFDLKIPDEKERINFILASYNAGPGHVLDAMKLAEKNGKDPQKWDDNVAVWILKKSERQYYNDKVVKNGYFKGTESVAFVTEVMNRYEHYKNIVPSEKLVCPPPKSPF